MNLAYEKNSNQAGPAPFPFLFAVSSAVVGAIVVSYLLLLLLEKTYQTVNLTVGQVMEAITSSCFTWFGLGRLSCR